MLHVIPPIEHQGRVTYLEPHLQWGYLETTHDHRRLYFDRASVAAGLDHLRVGDLVHFTEHAGHQQLRAAAVTLLTDDGKGADELPQTD